MDLRLYTFLFFFLRINWKFRIFFFWFQIFFIYVSQYIFRIGVHKFDLSRLTLHFSGVNIAKKGKKNFSVYFIKLS